MSTTPSSCVSVDEGTLCNLSFANTGWEYHEDDEDHEDHAEKTITVANLSKKSIIFPPETSPMGKYVVHIDFDVKERDYDITLTAKFKGSSSSSYKVVDELKKTKTGVIAYSFPETGRLELVFNNDYSIWNAKTITYTMKTRSQMCESTGERILRSIAIHNGHTQMIALPPDKFFGCIKYRGAPISTAQPRTQVRTRQRASRLKRIRWAPTA